MIGFENELERLYIDYKYFKLKSKMKTVKYKWKRLFFPNFCSRTESGRGKINISFRMFKLLKIY
jgi:hypothetical protein